jgi:hypothetical protein
MTQMKKTKQFGTEILDVCVLALRKAPWNYKVLATEEEVEKLSKSIERDKSGGVFAVREIQENGETVYEIMDGNHRLDAVNLLGWGRARVENFGPITKAEAITIARRRNFQWFEDDIVLLAQRITEDVLPEIPIDDLVVFMPDTIEDLDAYAMITQRRPDTDLLPGPKPNPGQGVKMVTIRAAMTVEAFEVYKQARMTLINRLQEEGQELNQDQEIATGQVLELFSAEYLASYGGA